jgi:hypothetical protein
MNFKDFFSNNRSDLNSKAACSHIENITVIKKIRGDREPERIGFCNDIMR